MFIFIDDNFIDDLQV